ncbi:MAG: hypothetical protein D6753_15080 [Planctomycetota bacterium]|nr:MAG: hypothetical protein D6753_15080 [Planctomycetota bacterium]
MLARGDRCDYDQNMGEQRGCWGALEPHRFLRLIGKPALAGKRAESNRLIWKTLESDGGGNLMLRSIAFLALALSGLPAVAQDATLATLYGEGVHRYFAGDCAGSHEVLSRAVEAGSMDPRVYYFRGLAQECLGGDGTSDFATAAKLEAEGKFVVDVGQALQRIQGPVRVKIEKLRREAMFAARQARLAAEQARRAAAAEAAKKAAKVPPPPPAETDPTDPVVAGLRADQTVPEPTQPAVAEISPGADLAGGGAAAQPEPSTETPPATPATTDDPFGGASPAAPAGDPFSTEPAGSDPFGTPAGSSGNDDPFGSDPFGSGN